MYYIFETVIRSLSLWAFVAIAAISALVCVAVMFAPIVGWMRRRKLEALIVAPLVVGIILYGGSKGFISYPQTNVVTNVVTPDVEPTDLPSEALVEEDPHAEDFAAPTESDTVPVAEPEGGDDSN